MTLPFFGAGLVEIPPEGYKRAKNSRKMQMVFFVHEGKVMVDVGAQGMPGEVNSFAISKGGVWVVPRGKLFRPFSFSYLHSILLGPKARTEISQRKSGDTPPRLSQDPGSWTMLLLDVSRSLAVGPTKRCVRLAVRPRRTARAGTVEGRSTAVRSSFPSGERAVRASKQTLCDWAVCRPG